MNKTSIAMIIGMASVWTVGICMISIPRQKPKADIVQLSPTEELKPQSYPEPELRPPEIHIEASADALPVAHTNYSPGGKDWHTPTEKETKEWKHAKYLEDLHAWAKPQLDKHWCQKCKRISSEDFRFLDRDGDIIRFKCKCHCGKEHTITLMSEG